MWRREAPSAEGEQPTAVNQVRTRLPTARLLDPSGSDRGRDKTHSADTPGYATATPPRRLTNAKGRESAYTVAAWGVHSAKREGCPPALGCLLQCRCALLPAGQDSPVRMGSIKTGGVGGAQQGAAQPCGRPLILVCRGAGAALPHVRRVSAACGAFVRCMR